MALTKPTANIFFDTRTKIKKSGKHPVKLTVYYLGIKRRYKLPHYFTKVEWEKLNSPRLRDTKLKDEKIKLDSYTGERFENALKQIENRLSSGYHNYRNNGGVVGRKNGYRKSKEDMQVQYAEEIKMLRKGYNYQHISQITNINKNTLTKLRQMFVEA